MTDAAKIKRLRTLKAKPGELRAYFGRADRWSGPDICYAWAPGIHPADARLLHNALSNKQMTLDFPSFAHNPSFVEELEARGYDISTLRFSIQKKKTAPPAGSDVQ